MRDYGKAVGAYIVVQMLLPCYQPLRMCYGHEVLRIADDHRKKTGSVELGVRRPPAVSATRSIISQNIL